MNTKIISITYSALTVAILYVGGYVLYTLSGALALPGNRFILLAPFLSFVFYFPIVKLKQNWLFTKINVVLALVLAYISIFMSLAICATGLLTDLTALLIFRPLDKNYKIVLTCSFYPVYAVLTSFYVTTYLTTSTMFANISIEFLLILISIVYILGLFGSYMAFKLKDRILHKHYN
jgi:energy-coupling factor transport system substrate-specific component